MKKIFLIPILCVGLLLTNCNQEKKDGALSKSEKQEVMQNKTNRVSPTETVSAIINENQVQIVYGSPRVKGRVIWGGLVPLDSLWRTGANEATTISFSKDVLIEGKFLKKANYALFTIPSKDTWDIIFNFNETQWGAFKYDSTEDALKIKTSPIATDSLYENLTFVVIPDSLNLNAGTIRFLWEKLQWDFHFENAL